MQENTSTIASNYTNYRSVYLIKPYSVEDMTSSTHLLQYTKLDFARVNNDDPKLVLINLNTSNHTVSEVKAEGVGNKNFKFSVGRYGSSDGASVYSYKASVAADCTNNFVFYQFSKTS